MSEVPDELWYTKEHEWIRIEGDEVVIGITDHAQNALTDIVYIELPEDGMDAGEMEEFAIVESVKSASPIFAPVAGTVIAVNMITGRRTGDDEFRPLRRGLDRSNGPIGHGQRPIVARCRIVPRSYSGLGPWLPRC